VGVKDREREKKNGVGEKEERKGDRETKQNSKTVVKKKTSMWKGEWWKSGDRKGAGGKVSDKSALHKPSLNLDALLDSKSQYAERRYTKI